MTEVTPNLPHFGSFCKYCFMGTLLLGKPVLPIESQTVEQLVTAGITTVAALVAWWKNNSFTTAALQADQTYDKLKAQRK